jgi:plasmid stabilization system protein ParE
MTVRWSPEAADDFAAIVERIRQQNPSAADKWPIQSTTELHP